MINRNLDYNSVFMHNSPFTDEQIRSYNRYSWYDVDINKEFDNSIKIVIDNVNTHYPGEKPEAVEIALYYYRMALYNYYLEEIRAKNKNPGSWFVGPSNYKGNPEAARKISENAMEKLDTAKEYLRKAIKSGHVEEDKTITKKENDLQIGDKIKVWWTTCNMKLSGNATITKINVKTMLVSLNEEVVTDMGNYPIGHTLSIPLICTPNNKWEHVNKATTPKTKKELQTECYESLKGKFKVGDRVYNTFYRFEGEIIKINKLSMVIKGEPTYSRDNGLRKVPIDESMNRKIEA